MPIFNNSEMKRIHEIPLFCFVFSHASASVVLLFLLKLLILSSWFNMMVVILKQANGASYRPCVEYFFFLIILAFLISTSQDSIQCSLASSSTYPSPLFFSPIKKEFNIRDRSSGYSCSCLQPPHLPNHLVLSAREKVGFRFYGQNGNIEGLLSGLNFGSAPATIMNTGNDPRPSASISKVSKRDRSSGYSCSCLQPPHLPNHLVLSAREKVGFRFYGQNGTIKGLLSGLNFGSAPATIMNTGNDPFVEHFDVRIVSSLPSTHLVARRSVERRIPHDVSRQWIRTRFFRQVNEEGVLVLKGLDSKLSKNLPSDLQKLRCKVAFHALRFAAPIREIGNKLARRMWIEGLHRALHLRLEKDVWVRTGCSTGLGPNVDHIIAQERESRPEFLTGRLNMSYEQRKFPGLCPLNALEVARLLKAPGIARLYIAGSEPQGGNQALRPLQKEFPGLVTKELLTKEGELAPYVISLSSDVFMPSHGGNIGRDMQGYHAYNGHRKYIKPNKRMMIAEPNKRMMIAYVEDTLTFIQS